MLTKAINAIQKGVFEVRQIAIKKRKLRKISNTLSKYLPTYEGAFFSRANSPSAASIPDFKMMKNEAKMYYWFRIQ